MQTRISWDSQEVPLAGLPEQLRGAAAVSDDAGETGNSGNSPSGGPTRLTILTDNVTDTVAALLQTAGRLGRKIDSLEVLAPTLEDTYLSLIGEADRTGRLDR